MIEDAAPPIERRRARRYPVRFGVTVYARDAQAAGVRGHTVDVSTCGLRLVTESEMGSGTDRTVIIEVPGEPIVARADLLRTEHRGAQWVHRLLFVALEPHDEARLARLCIERS